MSREAPYTQRLLDYVGNNQEPAFIEKIRKQISTRCDWPRHIIDDQGFFEEV
jgi:hypothetical protein